MAMDPTRICTVALVGQGGAGKTTKVWNWAADLELPAFLVAIKCDKADADLDARLAELAEQLGLHQVLMTMPIAECGVMAGAVTAGTPCVNADAGKSERLGHLLKMEGKKTCEVELATVGEVIAVAKLKDTHAG